MSSIFDYIEDDSEKIIGGKISAGEIPLTNGNYIPEKDFDKIFSCNDLKKFANSIKEILLFRGYSESKFFICEIPTSYMNSKNSNNAKTSNSTKRAKKSTRVLVKMAFYKKTNPEIYQLSDENKSKSAKKKIPPHDAEILTLKLFKEKIINKNISPCIVELLYYKKCSSASILTPQINTCHQFVTGKRAEKEVYDSLNIIFCNYSELVRNDLAFDKFNYIVLERCDLTFQEYLTRLRPKSSISFEQFRSCMFQIIYTIYRIKKLYPSFRHGDLHSENIMIKYDKGYYFDPLKPKFYKFYIDDVAYYVPYFGIVCKIIDFGFTVIEEENIKSSISGDKFIMFRRTKNDLLFLLSDIWNIQSDNKMVLDFLRKLEPNGTYFHYNTDYISHIDEHIPTYREMATNEVFSKYKSITPPPNSIIHEFAK